jgi:hypothetical protein
MRRSILPVLAALALFAGSATLADDRPYTEGHVINLSFIKVKPGQFDAYMKYLATTYKPLMEEQKKAGLIVDYTIFASQASSPQDADLILSITYANWAAFDGLEQKTEAMLAKAFGSRDKMNQAAVDREAMRQVLGEENVQELILK